MSDIFNQVLVTKIYHGTYQLSNIIPTKSIALAFLSLSLIGCQSTYSKNDVVVRRSSKVFDTTGYGHSKMRAKESAILQASQVCSDVPIIISDKIKYNGLINETFVRVVDQAGSVVGSIINKKSPSLFSNDDYEYSIIFKCE